MIHKMVTSKYFDLAISAVIGLNVITMAMEFYMMPRVSRVEIGQHLVEDINVINFAIQFYLTITICLLFFSI